MRRCLFRHFQRRRQLCQGSPPCACISRDCQNTGKGGQCPSFSKSPASANIRPRAAWAASKGTLNDGTGRARLRRSPPRRGHGSLASRARPARRNVRVSVDYDADKTRISRRSGMDFGRATAHLGCLAHCRNGRGANRAWLRIRHRLRNRSKWSRNASKMACMTSNVP